MTTGKITLVARVPKNFPTFLSFLEVLLCVLAQVKTFPHPLKKIQVDIHDKTCYLCSFFSPPSFMSAR